MTDDKYVINITKGVFPIGEAIWSLVLSHPYIWIGFGTCETNLSENGSEVVSPLGPRTFKTIQCPYNDSRSASI